MRIVFDTNVLIAALITAEGACGNLVKRCAQVHTPITSEFILNELREKLTRKFKKKQSDVDDAVTTGTLTPQDALSFSWRDNAPACAVPLS